MRIYKKAQAYCNQVFNAPVDETRGYLERDELTLSRNESEQGTDGHSYSNGIRWRTTDNDELDTPFVARGIGADLGRLEQLGRTDSQWTRIIETADQLIINADIHVKSELDTRKRYPKLSEEFNATLKRSNRLMEGGIKGVIREQVYSLLTAGFAGHILMDRPDGTVRKAALRRSNTFNKWILDKAKQNNEAVEFKDADGNTYVVPMEHLLLTSWRRLGTDLETYGPLRVAAPWIITKQMIAELWFGRIEKYASPIIGLEDSSDRTGTTGIEEITDLWDRLDASQYPVLTLGPNTKIHVIDLKADSAVFQDPIKFCDDQILTILNSESASIGLRGTGSFALSEDKTSREMNAAISVVTRVIDALNGVDNVPWQGLNKRVIRNTWGSPLIEGSYPYIELGFGEDEAPMEDVFRAIELMPNLKTPEVEEYIATRLKLPYEAVQ